MYKKKTRKKVYQKNKLFYEKTLTQSIFICGDFFVTLKKLHFCFPVIEPYFFWPCKSLEGRFHTKKSPSTNAVHSNQTRTIYEIGIYAQGVCAFPEELLELRLCCCAGVLKFVIIIEISINFLDLKKLKIKKQQTDKMQLTHFRMVPSFYFP